MWSLLNPHKHLALALPVITQNEGNCDAFLSKDRVSFMHLKHTKTLLQVSSTLLFFSLFMTSVRAG